MSDEFEIVIPVVRSEGIGVPVNEIQRAINSICQQVQTDLNEIASGGFPLTDVDITGGTIANVAISNSTATEQGYLDDSKLIATDSFVKRSILAASATIPINMNVGGGGTYNFASIGTGAQFVIFASSGVITSILSIVAGGSGYQVGDCLTASGGNGDAVIYVSAVSGGAVTTAAVLYGGTGYTTGATLASQPLPPGSRTGALTGALTSNATIVIPAGTYLQGGRRIGFRNNTTGAFTVTVKLSNGSGGSTGTGTVLAQGSGNSTSELLYTDGQNDVWPEVLAAPSFTVSGTLTAGTLSSSNAAITGGAISGSTGAFTTLSASSTVSGSGFSTYLASPPAIGSTTPGAVSSTSGALNGTLGATTPSTVSATTIVASSTITPSQTAGIVGTTTNNNANAGSVGEYVSSTVASGSAVSLTTATPANVTSISLTAGDWDVFGNIAFLTNSTTVVNYIQGGINTTSATLPAGATFVLPGLATGNTASASPVATVRVSVASTTTVYLVAQSSFTTSTQAAYGFIGARRRR